MDNFGLNFSPTATLNPDQQQGAGATPIQEAIRTLSFKIPRVVGASGLAPGPLLNSPGASGLPGGMDLEALLRRMFGIAAPGGAPGAPGPLPSGGMAPPMPSGTPSFGNPHVLPGAQPGRAVIGGLPNVPSPEQQQANLVRKQEISGGDSGTVNDWMKHERGFGTGRL